MSYRSVCTKIYRNKYLASVVLILLTSTIYLCIVDIKSNEINVNFYNFNQDILTANIKSKIKREVAADANKYNTSLTKLSKPNANDLTGTTFANYTNFDEINLNSIEFNSKLFDDAAFNVSDNLVTAKFDKSESNLRSVPPYNTSGNVERIDAISINKSGADYHKQTITDPTNRKPDVKEEKLETIEVIEANANMDTLSIIEVDEELNGTIYLPSDYEMEEDDNNTCVGDIQYCNYTEAEYTAMLLEYIFPQPFEWVLIASHSVVFLVGLVGNALVCYAVYTNHSMRTVTNYFIVNLAVADFMVILFCLPPTVLWDVTETWFMGEAMCKIVLYFQNVSVTVSVLTLTFISIDRWYAICFPLRFKSTTNRAKTAICVIWFVALIFDIPELMVLTIVSMSKLRFDFTLFTQCTPTWSKESDIAWHIVKAVLLYTLPLMFMTVAYYQIVKVLWRSDTIPGHRESRKMSTSLRRLQCFPANTSTQGQLRARRKAAKMLVAVVMMFAVCYLPVHILSIFRYSTVLPANEVTAFMSLISHWLCYANSAVNPLIYNFMSGKFRREFRRAFFKCRCCGCKEDPDIIIQSARQSMYNAPTHTHNQTHISNTQTSHSRNSLGMYRLRHVSPVSPTTQYHVPLTTTTSFINDNNGSGNGNGTRLVTGNLN